MPVTDATHNTTQPSPPGGGMIAMPPAEELAVAAIQRLITEGYTSSVMKLKRATLNELGRRLIQPGETVNDAAVQWLEAGGYGLKKSSVYRFAQRFREVYKRIWGEWANKLIVAQMSADPNFNVAELQDLIKNRVTTLVAQEVMTCDPSELKTDRLNTALSLVIAADKGRLDRDKLDLARKQAEDRAAKLQAEVERLTLENDKRRRELQRAIEAAKKDVQTAVEGQDNKSITEDQVIAILDRVMKGESPGSAPGITPGSEAAS